MQKKTKKKAPSVPAEESPKKNNQAVVMFDDESKITHDVKKRNWAFVLYPESAPENWVDFLEKTGLPIAISPLHDKDVNPDGQPKKPHYHVLLVYPGPTTFSVVRRMTERLNCPIPQLVETVKGYYRYLTHRDNPEKAQYDERDIRLLNGFSIMDYAELTRSEAYEIKLRILDIVYQQDIFEYSGLIDYLYSHDLRDELDIAMSNTIFLNTYLTSRRHRSADNKGEAQANPADLASQAGEP